MPEPRDVPPVYNPPADTGQTDHGGIQSHIDLGSHIRVTYWDGFTEDVPKTRDPLQDALLLAQIKREEALAATAGAGVGANAAASVYGTNVRAEIDRAQMAATAAHNAALLALQQGNAAEARRQFDISSTELKRSHDLEYGVQQQQADLAKGKFGFDVYNKLAELASNPRNFMEQFFRLRGQEPPANAAQCGNTPISGPGIVPFERFLPSFLQATGLGGPSAGAAGKQWIYGLGAAGRGQEMTAASGEPYQLGPLQEIQNRGSTSYYGQPVPTTSGPSLAITAKPLQVGPAVPGTSFTTAEGVPGYNIPTGTGTGSVTQQQAENPKQTVLVNGRPTPIFAKGGSLTMTAPHALVNLLSGKVAAIAGEAGPEKARFSGDAIINPMSSDDPWQGFGDPIVPQPPAPPYDASQLTPGVEAPIYEVGGAYPQTPATTAPPPAPVLPPALVPQAQSAPLPLPETAFPSPISFAGPVVPGAGAIGAVPSGGGPAGLLPPSATAPTQPPAPLPFMPQPPPPPAVPVPAHAAPVPAIGGDVLHPQVQYDPAHPERGGYQNGVWVEPSGPAPSSPAFLRSIANLSSTPSGLGKNPQFLPEDVAAQDPILAKMLQSGAFPPFLQRIFAQQRGLAGLGTNVPQQTNLPPGVPLVSKLAFTQMNPSEQQAFISYISAHGLSPDDYFAMVEAASPQGGGSRMSSYPKFLQQ